jgi:hypothetical protein
MPYFPGDSVEVDVFVRAVTSKLTAACAAGATTITVADASRWASPQVLKIDDGDPQMGPSEIVTISSISGAVVTLSAGTLRAHPAGTPVARILDATLAAQVEEPDGTDTSLSLSSVTTGRYRGSVTVDQAGQHDIEVVASGTAVGASSVSFDVVTDKVS